jgi:hypothetical protein
MYRYLTYLRQLGMPTDISEQNAALQWARSGNLTEAQYARLGEICREEGVVFQVDATTNQPFTPLRTAPATAGARTEPQQQTQQHPQAADPNTSEVQTLWQRLNSLLTGGGQRTQQSTNSQSGQGLAGHDSTNGADYSPEGQRQAATATGGGAVTQPTGGAGSRGSADLETAEQQRQQAIEAERQRVQQIRQLHDQHPDVPEEVVRQAESEGWTVDRTRTAFLDAMREGREDPVGPAVHVRRGMNLRALQAALLMRENITPDSEVINSRAANNMLRHRNLQADWMVGVGRAGPRRDSMEQAFEIARQQGLDNASMMRICAELVELESGRRAPFHEDEILERAFTSGGFQAVFGSVVHMSLLAGYQAQYASYEQWANVVEVNDFRKHEDAIMGSVGRLQKMGKNGGKAALLNVEDPSLAAVQAARYAGLLRVDEQTIIQDTFGVTGQLPAEVGKSSRGLISDLVMAELMSLENLADGDTRFNTTDDNLITAGSLDLAGLTAANVKLRNIKRGKQVIDVGDAVLLTGTTLGPTADQYLGSNTLVGQGADADLAGQKNPHFNRFRLVEDQRVDIGVTDPNRDEADVVGRPDSYFLLGTNARSVTVAFRRGTNFGPITRSKMLDEGQWGVAWDVYVDVGAAFGRRIGAVEVRT